MTTEKITKDDDFLHCLCDNTPDTSGFNPCLDDGTQVEPDADGPWAGELYLCLDCGRIVNYGTLEVTGRVPVEDLWKCPGCGWASHECMCDYPCAACFAHDGVPMPAEGATS